MADIRASLILDTKQAEKGIKGVGNALKAVLGAAAVREVGQLGNAFQEITNKLKTVTPAGDSVSASFDRVFTIAGKTRGGLEETADLFFRLTKASENLGLSTDEVSRVTELFNKTLQISGAGSQEAASAILQFSQAMASGKLAGDEFRSLNETNSDLMDRLAKALGKPRGELKKLASEGKLTAKVLASALLESADSIDSDFGKTTATLAQSLTNIRNNFIRLIGKIEETTGVFGGLASVFNTIADNLNIVGAALAGVFAAAVVGQIMAVVTAIRAFRAANQAAAASAIVLQAVTGVGLVKIGVGLAAATGTLLVMNNLMDDNADATGDLTTETDKAVGSTKELFTKTEELTEEQKKQKTIADETARILARQIEDFQSMGDELKLNSDEFRNQLDLQDKMLLATEDQKAVIQAVADLESDRKDALVDLAALTQISDADRLSQENKINEEYDERIRLTKEQLSLNQVVTNAGQQFADIMSLVGQGIAGATADLKIMQTQLNANSQAERDGLEFLMNLRKSSMQNTLQLNQDIQQGEVELLKRIQKTDSTRTQLTKKEKEQVRELFKERIDTDAKAVAFFDENAEQIITKFLEMRESARTFGQGFKDAFIQFEDDVTNAANFGAKTFDTLTQGWEDAFLKFAETGKLSFKDLFKALMQEIIKMMANKLFLSLFGGGGIFGDLFAGLFHKGGNIPAGQFGIAGERGPEIITGPASVMSTADTANLMGGGGTSINYTINAVDTQSFEMALAKDPSFVFAVTEAGRRKLPGRI